MNRTLSLEANKKIGEKVKLQGWVHSKRDHGKLTFIDLRDRQGKMQLVGYEKMSELGNEDVIEVIGTVINRNERSINPNLPTGTIEIDVESYSVLAKAKALPFDISKEDDSLFSVETQECDGDHLHLLLDIEPTTSAASVASRLKQMSTHRLWKKHGEL